MRKTLTLMVMMLVTALLVFAPVAAIAEDAPFANEMPANTMVYASVRTDDEYLDLLDSIFMRFADALAPVIAMSGEEVPAELSLRSILDEAFMDEYGADFDAAVRSWLGDYAAIGTIADADGNNQALVAVEITDKDAAIAFFSQANDDVASYEVTEENGLTIYYDGYSSYTAFSDDTMYVATNYDLLPITALDGTLAGSASFIDALAALPADDYNLVGYIDGAAISAAENAAEMFGAPDLSSITSEGGVVAFGATIAEGRVLIADAVSIGGDTSLYGALDNPIDPAFSQFIPSTASMVIHGSNFADILMTALEASGEDPAQFASISQMFQLDFETEFLPLFEGDYALFADISGLDPLAMADSTGIDPSTIQAGLVIETTNAENAQSLISGLNMLLMLMANETVTVTPGEVAGVQAQIITVSDPSLSTPLEVVIAANENVIVVATRAAAETALTGTGGLDSSATYQEASGYFLADPSVVAYLDQTGFSSIVTLFGLVVMGPAIENVFESITSDLGSGIVTPGLNQDGEEAMMAYMYVLQQFNSLSISTAINGDVASARFVIALSE